MPQFQICLRWLSIVIKFVESLDKSLGTLLP
nr:MAG TPA: hypothetical protein [Caudoviricetes sp.]DAS26219.1 MAG TPA: hypothetical protein [Caudoviricetes sp.]